MAVLKKYDFAGKSVGNVDIADELLKQEAAGQLVKDYLVALQYNRRQWSASTKNRSEVNKAGQKVQVQKGLGRARHGALSAPQFRKGGVVHGPRPKFKQRSKINRKAKRTVIFSLIAEKIKSEKAVVLKLKELKEPSTKTAFEFFKKLGLDKDRVLVLSTEKAENFYKSLRNLPKKNYADLRKVSGYELANCQQLVFLEPAINELKTVLQK